LVFHGSRSKNPSLTATTHDPKSAGRLTNRTLVHGLGGAAR
jgi:hypothetical protein